MTIALSNARTFVCGELSDYSDDISSALADVDSVTSALDSASQVFDGLDFSSSIVMFEDQLLASLNDVRVEGGVGEARSEWLRRLVENLRTYGMAVVPVPPHTLPRNAECLKCKRSNGDARIA
jgi:hypothetical protein